MSDRNGLVPNTGRSGLDSMETAANRPCSQCGVSLESASLLLVCDHHLCLLCAARALWNPSGSLPQVCCRRCAAVTDVDAAAAQYLEGVRPSSFGSPPGSFQHPATAAEPRGPQIPSERRTFSLGLQPWPCPVPAPSRSRASTAGLRGCEGPECSDCSQSCASARGPGVVEQRLWRGSPEGRQGGPLGSLLDAAVAAHGLATPRRDPVPLPRRFLGCPVHREEPLQYFCLRCQTDCICAECVLHGEHRGHEVLNVREAVRQLPEKVGELAAAARLRAEEVAGVIEHAKAGRREMSHILERGRNDVRLLVEQLSLVLQKEEEALLAEVDGCAADVGAILQVDGEQHLAAALHELRRHRDCGDAAQALLWYARVRQVVSTPAADSLDAERVAAQLKGQLQRGFESRLSGLASLAGYLAELRLVASATARVGQAS